MSSVSSMVLDISLMLLNERKNVDVRSVTVFLNQHRKSQQKWLKSSEA